jgi:predicted transcriptional regulator
MTLTVDSDWKAALRQAGEQFKQAWKTGEYQGESIGFATPALLFDTITHTRWEIIALMQSKTAPLTLQEISQTLGRNSAAVENDIQALLQLGLLEAIEDGRVFCPFEEIKAEFTLRQVA